MLNFKPPEAYRQILARGRSLQDHGLNETGLSKTDALEAAGVLREAGMPILGGDVWQWDPAKLGWAGNWCSEPKPGESWEDYAERSCQETVSYIERLPISPEDDLIFVLVIPFR